VWSVFLYRAESWTIKRSDRDRINSLEMWCWRRLLGVSWREHRTNESTLDEMGLEKGLMKSVARLKLQYFGHMVRGCTGELSLTILERAVNGTRHQGAPRMSWIHNVLTWSGKTYGLLKALHKMERNGRGCRRSSHQPPNFCNEEGSQRRLLIIVSLSVAVSVTASNTVRTQFGNIPLV